MRSLSFDTVTNTSANETEFKRREKGRGKTPWVTYVTRENFHFFTFTFYAKGVWHRSLEGWSSSASLIASTCILRPPL